MTTRLAATLFLLGVFAANDAAAQFRTTTFVIQPGSGYTYLPSLFTTEPFPDCDLNDDLQCDFEVSGSLTLEEFLDGTASIVDAQLELSSGVDPRPPLPLLTAEGVEDFLESLQLSSVPAPTITTIYEALGPTTIGLPPVTIAFDTPGFGGELTGGYNSRPVDGDGVDFRVTLLRVPEPGAVCLAIPTVALLARRRR